MTNKGRTRLNSNPLGTTPASAQRVDERERELHSPNGRTHKAEQGQFFTPTPIAQFMASLFDLHPGPSAVLDPGAGLGVLSSAFADLWFVHDLGQLSITLVENDPSLQEPLQQTNNDLRNNGIETELVCQDYLHWYANSMSPLAGDMAAFDYAILNPPYFKISSRSDSRLTLRSLNIETSNMYAAFLAVTARALKPGGQLVAITPRSFANGTYFRRFRQDFFGRMSFATIHSIDSRSTAFAHDQVLQETVIFHARKEERKARVQITTGGLTRADISTSLDVAYSEIQSASDVSGPIRIPRDKIDLDVNCRMENLPCTLADLGLAVSTGQIVDFRSRPYLRHSVSNDDVPLLYPRDLSSGGSLNWSPVAGKRPVAVEKNAETTPLLMPMGSYVAVKRFTAKEERKRVVASSTGSLDWPSKYLAFENHLNVYHSGGQPLEAGLATGLAAFLNSSVVDLYFRQVSGHTQVNAADLRSLKYPTIQQLQYLGRSWPTEPIGQENLDRLVLDSVPDLKQQEGQRDYIMAHHKILEAQQVLQRLGLPKPQTNERSALTLLAVLALEPGKDWSDAGSPLMGITPMMDFMREQYGKDYAPNSRETVRRHTVHQFVDAGILHVNPDHPGRPTNSGLTVYQVPEQLLETLRTFGTDDWDTALSDWLILAPSLRKRWREERTMEMIPVSLPEGADISLSPGGQSPLIKKLIEEFCPRYTPQGKVIYVGDARSKFVLHEQDAFDAMGITLDEHGVMPDLIVLDEGQKWLFLMEAVTSHGPMDPKRKSDLSAVFSEAGLGLIYVTAFEDKQTFARFLQAIAWETEVWVAEDPTHMIHFDGERFLGPYD